MSPVYGQVVCGPPGSGKTTYCNGMQHYLEILGRNAAVINLDPANEMGQFVPSSSTAGNTATEEEDDEDTNDTGNSQLPYSAIFDVCEEVVNLSAVMEQTGLGPNGGLMFCMEYLEEHVEEIIGMLQQRIQEYKSTTPTYLIIDLPGQVELYTHSTCVQHILQRLVKSLDLRLTAVQLIDAHYCADPHKFLSAALLGTTTMIRLELPTVNVLSKVDLLSQFDQDGDLPFGLEFFTECHDLQRLVPFLDGMGTLDTANQYDDLDEFDFADDPDYQKARQKTRTSKFRQKRDKLQRALADVVEDFGLLGFLPLDITHAESVGRVLAKIDKCNGYVFSTSSATNNTKEDLFQCAIANDDNDAHHLADIQERIQEQREWLQEQDQLRQQLKQQEELEREQQQNESQPPNFPPAAKVAYVHPKKNQKKS
ncbi:loop GTPase 2 [Seminavis robusta]|uniref:GPN-loop GTPase 2 n=1 Tax=Seminavis robusta TaxID=568900 RepID=A0A9N8DQY2_9STRA|nr:loop GTPase 2 [Seminavis robusta]|eukprot:Sro218_g090210.1 loop GTPase 2 (424) ;mRNA; f:81098-82369